MGWLRQAGALASIAGARGWLPASCEAGGPLCPSYSVTKSWGRTLGVAAQLLQAAGLASGPVETTQQLAAGSVTSSGGNDKVDPSKGFVRGGYSVAMFPPERVRNFSIIAHVDHGACALPLPHHCYYYCNNRTT